MNKSASWSSSIFKRRSSLAEASSTTSRHTEWRMGRWSRCFRRLPGCYTRVLFSTKWLLAFLTALYVFLLGLKIMGDAFQTLGGCQAGTLFDFIDNPIAGLMVGILSTVLVQSSSTSTSIIVSLVGTGGMSVQQAMPVVMGANIGTTITSTLVACGQISHDDQFERAFSAATVHDVFNLFSVMILMPIEIMAHPLSQLADWLIPEANGSTSSSLSLEEDKVSSGSSFNNPIHVLVNPISKFFLQVNKDIIKDPNIDCRHVKSILKGGVFYEHHMSDTVAGAVSLAISILLSVLALLAIVKVLNFLFRDAAEKSLTKAMKCNGVLMILIGAVVTILVQSSSITTSVLTPLVGVGVVQIEDMFALVLGANIGTTGTGFIAAMVSSDEKNDALKIAMCHFLFNIFGILIWYPLPFMRRCPIQVAKCIGSLVVQYKWLPIVYILSVFVAFPGLLLGLSVLYSGSTAMVILAGLLTLCLVGGILGFIVWFKCYGGHRSFPRIRCNYCHYQHHCISMSNTSTPIETPIRNGDGNSDLLSHYQVHRLEPE